MKKLNIILSILFLMLLIGESKAKIENKKKKRTVVKSRKLDDDDNTEESDSDDSEDDSDINNSKKGKLKKEIYCQNELLYSFGILNSGHRKGKSLLCSNVEKETCCSKTSEKLILNFWKNNNKLRIKEYMEGYVLLFKKILNFYENYLDKAKKVHSYPSAPAECKEASKDLISYFQDRTVMTNYFLKFEKTFQHLGFVRKSFYCVLCTTDTQGFFDTENKTITYANKFCENLVESTINEFYERNTKYMRIINNINTLTNCETNNSYNPDTYNIDMTLDEEDDIALTKCYQTYQKDQDPRVFVPECLDYCGKFSITAAKEIFEGSFGKLYYVYNKIKSKNMIPKNPVFKEIDVDIEYDFSHIGVSFFESNLKGFDLGNYLPVFERNGIELFYISAKTNLVFGPDGLVASVDVFSWTLYYLFFTMFFFS